MSSISDTWVDEPDGRGTWDLIQTCLVTLFFCIYTAIHLNIRPHRSKKASWLRRVGATCVASALPELMFVCAISQWNLAKQLQLRLNNIQEDAFECERCKQNETFEKPESTPKENTAFEFTSDDAIDPEQDTADAEGGSCNRGIRRSGTLNELERGFSGLIKRSRVHSHFNYFTSLRRAFPMLSSNKTQKASAYTLSQAFFIVGGGLAVETKAFHKEPYLTITPTGAIELAGAGLLNPVPKDVIDDKAKADPITKVVVCIQAAWFIVQCIARTAQHLPLTLLEIHVLAHVFVCLLMYLFWFAKPYNVLSPVIITDTRVIEMAALFTLHKKENSGRLRCVMRDELDAVNVGGRQVGPTSDKKGPKDMSSSASLLESSESVPASNGRLWGKDISAGINNEQADVAFALAQRSLQRLQSLNMHFTYFQNHGKAIWHRSTYLVPYLSDFSKNPGCNLSKPEIRPKISKSKPGLIYKLLPSQPFSIWVFLLFISYAGFHLSAWNAHFPTTIERWMWRGAGLSMIGFPVLFFVVGGPSVFPAMIFEGWKNWPHWAKIVFGPIYGLALLIEGLGLVICTFILMLPAAGRLYFLVEAFLSLRDPGPRVYDTVQWTLYWPHG